MGYRADPTVATFVSWVLYAGGIARLDVIILCVSRSAARARPFDPEAPAAVLLPAETEM